VDRSRGTMPPGGGVKPGRRSARQCDVEIVTTAVRNSCTVLSNPARDLRVLLFEVSRIRE
jgi:hypothetical protein